jgi:hypothetical protein
MFDRTLPHQPLPQPGELGPDPEPLGTERFERLMQGAFAAPVQPPVVLGEHRVIGRDIRRPRRPCRKAA